MPEGYPNHQSSSDEDDLNYQSESDWEEPGLSWKSYDAWDRLLTIYQNKLDAGEFDISLIARPLIEIAYDYDNTENYGDPFEYSTVPTEYLHILANVMGMLVDNMGTLSNASPQLWHRQ